jgi:hypothetical protein
MADFDQPEGVLLTGQGLTGKLKPFPVCGQDQPPGGNLGDQTDLDAAPGLLRGQILLQGLILEAAYPAEQVQFVRTDPKADVILVQGLGKPGRRKVSAIRWKVAAASASTFGKRSERLI